MSTADDVLHELRANAGTAKDIAGMARFGIDTRTALGVRMPVLRKLARRIGKHHAVAAKLWASGIHEARILAALVDEPEKVTRAQMERWTTRFASWDVCDQVCCNLYDKTPHAIPMAKTWLARDEEFVKRAGYATVVGVAWHDKAFPDAKLVALLPLLERHADDERNYVKKGASWAFRTIGKRHAKLRPKAIASARRLLKGGPGARYVGRDVLRDLDR